MTEFDLLYITEIYLGTPTQNTKHKDQIIIQISICFNLIILIAWYKHNKVMQISEKIMSIKLNAGDQFPSVKLNIGESDSLTIPDDNSSPYTIVLFYRGHW